VLLVGGRAMYGHWVGDGGSIAGNGVVAALAQIYWRGSSFYAYGALMRNMGRRGRYCAPSRPRSSCVKRIGAANLSYEGAIHLMARFTYGREQAASKDLNLSTSRAKNWGL